MRSRSPFVRFAKSTSKFTGRPLAFLLAASVVALWLVSELFGFGDTWQLVINTGITIVTFLMVFLIQNTQYRDSEAVQIKLDELIRVTRGAHTSLLDLEELEDHELDKVQKQYQEIAEQARARLRRGLSDTDVPEVRPP